MYRHYSGRLLVLVLTALIWLGYEEIGRLGGTFLWPYRYLILALAAFLLLTIVNRISGVFADEKQQPHS